MIDRSGDDCIGRRQEQPSVFQARLLQVKSGLVGVVGALRERADRNTA